MLLKSPSSPSWSPSFYFLVDVITILSFRPFFDFYKFITYLDISNNRVLLLLLMILLKCYWDRSIHYLPSSQVFTHINPSALAVSDQWLEGPVSLPAWNIEEQVVSYLCALAPLGGENEDHILCLDFWIPTWRRDALMHCLIHTGLCTRRTKPLFC